MNTSSSGFGFGGLSSWTSGWDSKTSWGFDGGLDSKDNDAKNDNPWGLDKKSKKKESYGFDLNFDAFNTLAAPEASAPAEEVKKDDDNGDGWASVLEVRRRSRRKEALQLLRSQHQHLNRSHPKRSRRQNQSQSRPKLKSLRNQQMIERSLRRLKNRHRPV